MPTAEQIKLTSNTTCPSNDALLQYLTGWIEDPQSVQIESHLQSCPHCEVALKELESKPDTLLQSLQMTVRHSDDIQHIPDRVHAVRGDEQTQNKEDESPIRIALQQAKKQIDANVPPIDAEENSLGQPTMKVLGIYDLIRPLGRGGMGAVYLAIHRQLRKQVAIKLLPLMSGEDSDVRARFEREIRVVGRLNHPSIVAATDAGEIDGTQFLVMEYVPGLDLSRLARLMGRLPVAEACELMRQVALGLSCAHAEGVVHRDVKPSNLMLDESGRIRILDFGLAQLSVWDEASVDLTTVGQLMGTLDYMAPEQAELSGHMDYRADLYALGATLFRLLCGRPPLAAAPNQSPLEKLRLLANHQPPKLDTLCPEAPTELVKLVASLLSKNPQDRPASAAHVAEQLAPLATGSKLVELLENAKQKAALNAEPLKRSLVGELPAVLPHARTSQASLVMALQSANLNNGRRKNVRRLLLAALLPLLIIAGILIKLETSKGQLVIESEVDNVTVKLVKNGEPLNGLRISHGTTLTRLQADTYEIAIEGASDGLEIVNDKFTVKSGETVVARIQQTAAATEQAPALWLQSRVSSTDKIAPTDPIEAMRYKLYGLDVERQLLETRLGANHPQVLELKQEIEIRHAHLQELMAERDKASDISQTETSLYDGKPLEHWLDTLSREKSATGLKTAFDACGALATEENGEQIANVVLKVVAKLPGEMNLETEPMKGSRTVDLVAMQLLQATLPGPKFCSRWVTEFEAAEVAWRERLWKSYAPGSLTLAVEDVEPFIAWTEHRLLQDPAAGKDPDQDSLRAADQLRNMISIRSQWATDAFRSRVMRILTASPQLPISWWLSQPLIHRSGDDYYEVWPADYKMEVTRRAIEALQNNATSPSLVVQASIILANGAGQSPGQQQLISAAIGQRLAALAKDKSSLTQIVQTPEVFSNFSVPLLNSQSPLYLTSIQIEVRRSWVRDIPVIENSLALTLLSHAWKLDKGVANKSELDQVFEAAHDTFERIHAQMPTAVTTEEAATVRPRGFGRMSPTQISLLWPDLKASEGNSQAFAPGGPANMKQISMSTLWGKHEPTKQDWLEYLILLHPAMTERVTQAVKEFEPTPAAEAAAEKQE